MKVQFPAMRGVIGKQEYYSTLMALSEIPRFFKFNDWDQVDPAARAQRVLNVARIPEITRYILDNDEGYIFSSITVSYSCPATFIPSEQNEQMGLLEMDLEDMQFIINDGQHRSAAITQALKQKPELGKERISVLLFPTGDLDRLQQMFLDLNRFVNKTSKPMNVLYDHRDPLSALNIQVANQVPVFQEMVDMEKASIPLRSPQLLTLSALYDANSELLGSPIEHPDSKLFKDKVSRAIAYWTEVAKAIPDWQKVKDGELAAPALRQEKICTHAIILRALGGVGNTLFARHPNDWDRKIQALSNLDWRKSIDGQVNPLWDNVCIVAGSVVSHRQARVATLAVLKNALDLPLGNQERVIFSNLPKRSGSNGTRPAKASATIDPVS
ncbi:hypothetical protein KSF_016020 [Reticulibacter mediterranei]|uniref:DNA sulfur modification protein DndB n=1 Tax=Reticulibacter mediterranei TaxID=2778369 RepID=A0A8J3MY25_9CHLR|nr:DNA sulfur modification protein DndB [Reticulibacter mediterranei]GHO91554.1 hypothetical protein KSF_016020 [Reticulibacter mediterranei]